MPLPTSVIVVIMGWSDLYAASSELSINHLIANDDHLPLGDERVGDMLSNKILVARVFGVNCDCAIAKHCLQTSGGHLNKAGWVFGEGVFEVHDHSKLYLLFIPWNLKQGSLFNVCMLHLDIGDGSLKGS